jgi:hypothetical protein
LKKLVILTGAKFEQDSINGEYPTGWRRNTKFKVFWFFEIFCGKRWDVYQFPRQLLKESVFFMIQPTNESRP